MVNGAFGGHGDVSQELGMRGEQGGVGRLPTSRLGVTLLCGGPIPGTARAEHP